MEYENTTRFKFDKLYNKNNQDPVVFLRDHLS